MHFSKRDGKADLVFHVDKYKPFPKAILDQKVGWKMAVLSPSEDLRNWVVDNWFTVEDSIGFALQTMIVDSKKDILNDIANREDAVEFISERVKEGHADITKKRNN